MLFFYFYFMKEVQRCSWCEGDALYTAYHDTEWGVPLFDDEALFEFLLLETFQAGLSWITILRKRQHFHAAFDAFDYRKIAAYTDRKVAALMENPGIIRNRQKIQAALSNAQAFQELQAQYGSFSNYFWGFTDGKPIQNEFKTLSEIPPFTPLATTLSKDLKQKGFKFVGPTVIYAHMQATGLVNDHLVSCFRHQEVQGLKT